MKLPFFLLLCTGTFCVSVRASNKLLKDLPSAEKSLHQCGKFFNRKKKKISSQELETLQQYLMSRFEAINFLLRHGEDHWHSHKRYSTAFDLESIRGQIGDLDSALGRLPKYEGLSYRGTFLPAQTFNDIKNQGVFADSAFLSTTKQGDNLYMLPHVACLKEGAVRVWFIIEGLTGRDVTSFAASKNEQEVLFPRGSKFTVTSIIQKKAIGPGKDGQDYFEIKLKQVNPGN